jgi:acyl dehydratase
VAVIFDTVEEGDDLETVSLHLSKDQVRAYARVNGFSFPRFVDDEGARKEGLPGMIAPGNMSMGLLATFVEAWGGAGSLRRLGSTFRGLVLPDATFHLCAAVTEKDAARRTAELDVWMETDDGERVVIGTATVALR